MRRRRPREDDFAEAVAALYEAATDAMLWPAFLERFGAATESSVLTLHVHDLSDHSTMPIGASVGCDPASEQAYRAYYVSRNLYMARGTDLMRTGCVAVSTQVATRSEAKRSEYFDGFLGPLGVLEAMTACIAPELRPARISSGVRQVLKAAAGAMVCIAPLATAWASTIEGAAGGPQNVNGSAAEAT